MLQLLNRYKMSILIKSDSESSPSSSQKQQQLEHLLAKLPPKIMRSAKDILNKDIMTCLHSKYELLISTQHNVVQFLEYFIYCLLNHIDQNQQINSLDIQKEDYKVLEASAQKSQAEVRKHVRIQQQLKIYMDCLEEKVEELQKKLELEEIKYQQLFQSMREIDQQRRQLLKKMLKYEEEKQKSKPPPANYSTLNDQIYKDYYAGRKNKINTKSRHLVDKYNERSKKLSEKKSRGQLHFVDGAIQINLSNNIVVNKKRSYDQNLSRPNPVSHDSSIRQLIKTVQMKEGNSQQRRPNRKISKYKTEINEMVQKKQKKSSSVCD